MNFEGLEQFRFEFTKSTMEAMAQIAADPKADIADRIKAAKVVDAMSDSIIKAYILSEMNHTTEKSGNRLSKQLDKLMDEDKEA